MKHVIVTGAGSGIGYEISRHLLLQNYTPILLGRDKLKLEKASKELKNCPFFSVDLSTEDSLVKLHEFKKSLSIKNLVGLVNNAGVYSPAPIEDSSFKCWNQQFSSNVLSVLNTVKVFISELKDSSGSIVNISSTLGIRPIENTAAYSASKAAMNNFSLSLALEYAKYGIRVNAVCPGIVNTPIHDQNRTDITKWKQDLKDMQPLGRVGEPSEIAPLVTHLISSDSKWTTGAIINVDGGILLKS